MIEEVVQSLQPMLVEEVEVEEDAPRFEQSERLDLPDFMREEVRLLDDDGLLPEESVDTRTYLPFERDVLTQAVQRPSRRADSDCVPQMSEVQPDLQTMMSGVIAQGVQTHSGGTNNGDSISRWCICSTAKEHGPNERSQVAKDAFDSTAF